MNTRIGAGSSFVTELLGLKSDYIVASYSDAAGLSTQGSGTGKGNGKSAGPGSSNTYFYDGFYSHNLGECPVCPDRRRNLKETKEQLMTVGLTHPLETGSFNDGSPIYARFFRLTGITVFPNGDSLWVGDTGNNRVRNISCTSHDFPETFEPTFSPSAGPTYERTSVPTNAPKGKFGKGGVIGGKGAGKGGAGGVKVPGKMPKGWKAKKAGPKEASISIGVADFGVNFESIASLSNSSIALIAVGAIAASAAFVHFMFYRKYYFGSMK